MIVEHLPVANGFLIGAIVFVLVFVGALLGLRLRTLLPAHHLSAESKDIVKLGVGLIATMSALLLSLLLASAKGSYDAQRNGLIQMAANIVVLDRALAHYGPESGPVRAKLRGAVELILERMWPEATGRPSQLAPSEASEHLYDEIQALAVRTDAQRTLRAEALSLTVEIARARWLLLERSGFTIPMPFLLMLALWLALIFLSFGLFAPSNPTVVASFFICAIAIASAIFLIVELDQAFAGIIRVPSAPLRGALTNLGR